MTTLRSQHRPFGVTALGLFSLFGVLASGFSVVSLLTPGGFLEPMWRLNPRAQVAVAQMGIWAPILLGMVYAACAASAYGFLTGRRWGYHLGISLLVVNLIGDIANGALGIEPRAWVGVPIVGLLLWYLSSRKVRAYFSVPASGAD